MSGYVLIHRGLVGHPQFRGKDDEYAAVWLITQAVWEATTVRVAGKLIDLKRGQCCFATSFLAQAWECSKATAHARLKHFEKNDFIRTEIRTGLTVITICKYCEYQSSPNDARTLVQTSPERSPNAPRTKNKEGKEVKEDNKDSAAVDARANADFARAVGMRVLDLMGCADDPMRNWGRVHQWLADGADPEADIYPTVTRLMASLNGEPPRSLKYFDSAIADAVRQRLSPMPTTNGAYTHGNRNHHRPRRPSTPERRAAIAEAFSDCLDNDGRPPRERD